MTTEAIAMTTNAIAMTTNAIATITGTIATVLNTMTEDSQYSDFINEFEAIENEIKKLGDTHPVSKAYDELMDELYVCKGSLDCAKDDLDKFMELAASF